MNNISDITITELGPQSYYGGSHIVVTYLGNTYRIDNNHNRHTHTGNPEDVCEAVSQLCNVFLDSDYMGYDSAKESSYRVMGDASFVEYDNECNPIFAIGEDGPNIEYITDAEFKEFRLDMANEWLPNGDIFECLLTFLDALVALEAEKVVFTLKFGAGPIVLKRGFMTCLAAENPDLNYVDLMSERGAEVDFVLAVQHRHVVALEGSRYVVYYVGDDFAECWSTYSTYERAVDGIAEALAA